MSIDLDDLEFQLDEAMTFNGYNGLTDHAAKTIWEAARAYLDQQRAKPTDDARAKALQDVDLIQRTAGDLDFGFFGNRNVRGNIGGPVSRACERLRNALACLDHLIATGVIMQENKNG